MHINNNSIYKFGNLSLSDKTFEKIRSMGKCNIDNVVCTGPLICTGKSQIKNSRLYTIQASGNTELKDSSASNVTVSGHFFALDCIKLGNLQTSGDTQLHRCKNVENIVASGSLNLQTSQIHKDVTYTGKNLKINNCVISGKLECVNRVLINNSSINEIVVKNGNSYSYSFEIGFFKYNFTKQFNDNTEQIVELAGENCIVNSITFSEGCFGKVILKNGAKVTGEIIRGAIFDQDFSKNITQDQQEKPHL